MGSYAEIAVNISGVDGVFDYRIPPDLGGKIQPGCLVEVSYNALRAQGIIIRTKPKTGFKGEIKQIEKLIKPEPILPRVYIELAEKLASQFHQPLAAFLQSMLPPGISRRPAVLYAATAADDADLTGLGKLQLRLLAQLDERGPLRSTQLDHAFSRKNWRGAMRKLVERGLVRSETILPSPKISRKKVSTVLLHPDVGRGQIVDADTGKAGGAASMRRQKMLRMLADENKPVRVSYLYASTGGNSSDIRFLEKKGLVLLEEENVVRDPIREFEPEGTRAPALTSDQKNAWQVIRNEIHSASPQPIMLRGITGSGKTELYLTAAEEVVQRGEQALILVPEIALTPQTIQRFLDRFPGKVGVFHSRLSDGERFDTWQRAADGKLSVLIGPRSALLVPLPKVGLIVLDECHDDSYYQLEQIPLYDSRDGAIMLADKVKACLIFGSATPNVSRYFQAVREKWPLIVMEKRISSDKTGNKPTQFVPLPEVEIVDMRSELTGGNSSIFSRSLQGALKETVTAGHQAILFLNRRGSATIIFCRDCGYTVYCPRCSFPLTFHAGSKHLQCHTCGYTRGMPEKCPECGGGRIRQYGMGTEKVESALKQLIPDVRVLRWDADTSTGRNAEAVILSHFKNHNADVLVGTQMLAKGLDLPLVTLVGMILADVGLSFPDYRSSEHAFQLMTQVAGRAGRSELGGKAILQTFQPDHYAIQFSARHDFRGFFEEELDRRRDIQYPPYTALIRLETRDLYEEKAKERARLLAVELKNKIADSANKSLEMIGPVPPYFSRQRGYYRWQIILKGQNPGVILQDVPLSKWKITLNPPRLL